MRLLSFVVDFIIMLLDTFLAEHFVTFHLIYKAKNTRSDASICL